jgi:hypothetical protein
MGDLVGDSVGEYMFVSGWPNSAMCLKGDLCGLDTV